MSGVIFFFGSGLAFFVGAGLVVLAVLAASRLHKPALNRLARLTAIAGLILVAVSAAPLPYWYYAVSGAASLTWLILEYRRNETSFHSLATARTLVILLWLGGVAMEGQFQLTPTVAAAGRPDLWIIGDSLTAGTGNRIETWPKILARKHGVVIHDQSRIGATVGTALNGLEKEPLGDGIVLLEIGGNDLLGSTTSADFAKRLEQLLIAVCRPGRTVVMFELPLPPFCNEYGMAQRELAAAHGVILIPKRLFVEVLTTGDATLDSVHLSREGHEAMAELVWKLLKSAND